MKFRRYGIAPTLVLSIGLLVTLAVSGSLYLQWRSGRLLLADLGGRLVSARLDATETWLRGYLDPLRGQAVHIAGILRRSRPGDAALRRLLQGSLAALPAPGIILWIEGEGGIYEVGRASGKAGYPGGLRRPLSAEARRALRQAADVGQGYWGAPYFHGPTQRTYLNYRLPVSREGEQVGLLVTAMATEALNGRLAQLGAERGDTPFVLGAGGSLLLHPSGRSADPVVGRLAVATPSTYVPRGQAAGDRLLRVSVHEVVHVIALREVRGYGVRDLQVGSHLPRSRIDGPLRTLWLTLGLGLLLLAIATATALFLGRRIAAPVHRIAGTALDIARLDLAEVRAAVPSRIREIDDLAWAFNRAVTTLRQVEVYLPDRLVSRLVRSGPYGIGRTYRTRAVVMFTDIVGYGGLSGRLEGDALADLLDEVLGMQARCIAACGGVVDKFIGDAVMAFWEGGHELQARAACRAAAGIATGLNGAGGRVPEKLRLRIGIHVGPVVIGSIGADSRRDYTVVGDTVNVAQRLEQLAREHDQGERVTVLLSRETAAAAGTGVVVEDLGLMEIRGRPGRQPVARLLVREPLSRTG